MTLRTNYGPETRWLWVCDGVGIWKVVRLSLAWRPSAPAKTCAADALSKPLRVPLAWLDPWIIRPATRPPTCCAPSRRVRAFGTVGTTKFPERPTPPTNKIGWRCWRGKEISGRVCGRRFYAFSFPARFQDTNSPIVDPVLE